MQPIGSEHASSRLTQRVFYGWIITAVTWISYFLLNAATTNGGGIVATHLIVDRGMGDTLIGFINSCTYAGLVIASVPVSIFVKKRGGRAAYLIASLIGGSVFLVLFLTNAPATLYIIGYFFLGISIAMGGQVTGPILIDNWFDRRKALPMSILMTAGGIGGFLFPPVMESLCSAFGARSGLLVLAILEYLPMIPALFFAKSHPEEIGEIRDGRAWTEAHPLADKERREASSAAASLTLHESYRSAPFLKIAFLSITFRLVQGVFLVYTMISLLKAAIPSEKAVLVLSILSIFSLFGRIIVFITDKCRLPLRLWSAICFVFLGAGAFAFGAGSRLPVFILGAVFAGLATGFLTTLMPLLLSDTCGETYFEEQYGLLNTLSYIFLIIAPIVISAAGSKLGTYGPVYSILGGFCIAAVLLSLRLKKDLS